MINAMQVLKKNNQVQWVLAREVNKCLFEGVTFKLRLESNEHTTQRAGRRPLQGDKVKKTWTSSSQPSGEESTPLRDSEISTPNVIDTEYHGHPQEGADCLSEQVGEGTTHEERISELGLE